MTTTPVVAAQGSEVIGAAGAWGMSTSVDLQNCDPDAIRSRDHIRDYVVRLCELIEMRRFGECQIVHFGEGRVAGFSMLQLIETSLISGHFANDSNRAYLDIFSCKPYDPAVVEQFSREFFSRQRERRAHHAASMSARVGVWLRRYVPAEAASLIGALLAAQLAWTLSGNGAAAAVAGAWGETAAYYATMLARELARTRAQTLAAVAALDPPAS